MEKRPDKNSISKSSVENGFSDKETTRLDKGLENRIEERNFYGEEIIKLEKEGRSEDLHKEWQEKFSNKPAEFSSTKNLKELETMPAYKRVIMLGKESKFLTFTPQMTENYFKKFPEDLGIIKQLFTVRAGRPENTFEHFLFTVSASQMEMSGLKKSRQLEQYKEIEDRRNLAPDFLLNNFEYRFNDSFEEFGSGAEGFLKLLDEAGELSRTGERFINPDQIFSPEYEQMSEKTKAAFLRKAIAELQFSLVFEETFNSCQTKDLVEELKTRFLNNRDFNPDYDISHSILYKTYQPSSSYEANQKIFEWEMKHTTDRGGYIEEYPYHRLLLSVLDRIKDINEEKDSNTDVLVDFWNKNRNPIFANAVTEAMISQNTARAGKGLLELLRKEKTDKNPLAAVLHRLEFGKIGISKQGVKYLERMYDLGELNNPDFFVQRLTAKGDIGIFDNKKVLHNYFNLGDLESGEKVIKPRIHDFVYQTLFFEKEGEVKEERQKREQYLKEFKESYFHFYENEFFQKTGVRFNNLDFKEQGWFLNFYKNTNEEKKEILLDFVGKYREGGLRAFLSLEHGEEMGDRILEIGKNLDTESASLIFGKYGEIIDLIEKNSGDLSNLFKVGKGFSEEEMRVISNNSLKKGRDLLINFSEKAKNSKEGGLAKEDLLAELENYKNNLIFTAVVYGSLKELFKRGGGAADVSLEDFKDVSFEQITAEQVMKMPKELSQMLKIYSKNYEQKPLLQKKLINGFLKKIEFGGNNVVIYLYKKDREIIAFNRFDDKKEEGKYFGSCNVRPEIAGSSIGSSLIEASIKRETLHNEVVGADCLPEADISSHYIEKSGFAVKRVVKNYQDTGETVFSIERSPLSESFYRGYSQEEVIREYGEKFPGNKYGKASKRMILKFEKNSPELFKISEELVNEKGYSITRYFFSGEDVYCAFERGGN